MVKLLEPGHIDKPWKVTALLIGVDAVLKFPLRFFKSYLAGSMDLLFAIRMILFLIAVFLTGVIYIKTMKKGADKNLRFRVAVYYTIYSLIGTLFLYIILGDLMVKLVGGLVELSISLVVGFFAIYFILSLSNKFLKKR